MRQPRDYNDIPRGSPTFMTACRRIATMEGLRCCRRAAAAYKVAQERGFARVDMK